MSKLILLCLTVVGLVTACGGGGGNGDSGNTTSPSVLSQSPSTTLVEENVSFTLVFDKSMDASSFSLSGDLANDSDGGVWGQTNIIDDTLTISPSSNWFAKPGRSLTVNAQDLAGNTVTTILNYDIYRGTLYYVDISRPDDTGDGLNPVTARKFIHAAVSNASSPATILVAAGYYPLSHDLSSHVVLREGISLYGGYSIDFQSRDPATTPSIIEDKSNSTVGGFDAPHRAIEGNNFSIAITTATIIDGFTIRGSTQAGPDYTTTILLTNADPTIQNNTLHGGSGSFNSYGLYSPGSILQNNIIHGGSGGVGSYGIYRLGNAIIQNNTIHGGSGSNTSTGISVVGSSIIQNNTIHGGSGNISNGIVNWINSSPTVQNNSIHGGSGSIKSTGMVNNDNSSPTVQNNTIHSGSSSTSYSVFNATSGSTSVDNNILITGNGGMTYCFSENPTDVLSTPDRLRNNTFTGCATLYFDPNNRCNGGTDCTTIEQVNALTDITGGVSGNVAADPQFVDIDGVDDDINTMEDNDWHFTVDSPASVTAGGLNGIDEGWSFITDKDGVTRPASGNPWSIGAFEP